MIVHQHFHFALFRPDNNRLAAHTAYHIKGIHRSTAKRQFQYVFLNAFFQRLFQIVSDFEESVGRA